MATTIESIRINPNPAEGHSSLEAARTAAALRTYTERTQRLYDVVRDRMTRPQTTWGGDLDILSDPQTVGLPLVLRRATAFQKVLLEMPIAIEADDLIVGNTLQEGVITRTRLPKYGLTEEYAQAQTEGATLSGQLAHKTPYFYDILEKGLGGLITDLENKIVDISQRPASDKRNEKLALYRAMKLEATAVIDLAHRYAALALELSAQAGTEQRRDELLKIAHVCKRVPEHPAQTFHEAVQCFWFIHYALFSTGTHLSCGRFDQYLYPTLHKELAKETITLEQAQELIDCVWLRFNDRGQICRENFFAEDSEAEQRSTNGVHTNKTPGVIDQGPQDWTAGHRKRLRYAADAADAINHFGQNILLSGIRPDGTDGTNELTYLSLNALEKFAFTSPVVTVRLHKNSPDDLVARSAEVLKSGSGMPYLNNDDILIPAYVDLGVSLPDARDYANSNCWETMIEGKSDQELIRGMNFLLFLELALNRGVSKVHGRMGVDSGDPRHFATFSDLMQAWKRQTDVQLKAGIDYIGQGIASGTLEHSNHGKYSYNPLLSALTLD